LVLDLPPWLNKLPIIIFPFVFTILTLILSLKNFEYISWSILGIGSLSVGLSHGDLDHLTQNKIISKKQLFYFVANYLLKGALFAVVWFIVPYIALIIFILYSAWHFGQADFKEWGHNQGWLSFV